MNLEESLGKTQKDTDAALDADKKVHAGLRKLHAAAQSGTLRDLARALDTVDQTLAVLQQAIAVVREGWTFDEAAYWSNGAYTQELLEAARHAGIQIHVQDDRLYCYPSLVRVVPGDAVAVIDKKREKRLRPSVLVDHLKQLQQKPVKFKSEAFLESLHDAYVHALKNKRDRGPGAVVPLTEIYDLLTLLPGQQKEYSRHESARDLYLLDESGVRDTRQGKTGHLHPARGSEPERKVFSTVSKGGRRLRYAAISFE